MSYCPHGKFLGIGCDKCDENEHAELTDLQNKIMELILELLKLPESEKRDIHIGMLRGMSYHYPMTADDAESNIE